MYKFELLLMVLLSGLIKKCNFHVIKEQNNSLVLLNVLFRHGDRTPDLEEVYPKDPYSIHFKDEFGELTNEGKYREYLVGKALRQRYDSFLGNLTTNSVLALTTDYDRTKMSIELVLAGLYPPTAAQKWDKHLNWQPIPYHYKPFKEDNLLIDPKYNCPEYLKNYYLFLNTSEGRTYNIRNKELYDYLSKKTGWYIDSPHKVYFLSFILSIEENLGFTLPEWTKEVWPKQLIEAAVEQYYVDTATPKLRKLTGGAFIKKIVEDTRLKIMEKLPQDRKIFLYSAHESNLAYFLIFLDIFYPHIPPFGSFIITEVHKIGDTYGIVILYQDYTANQPRILQIPNCDAPCPFDKFIKLVEQDFPTVEDSCHQ